MEVWRYTYALYRVYRTMHCVQTYALRTDLYTVCIDMWLSCCCSEGLSHQREVRTMRSCIA